MRTVKRGAIVTTLGAALAALLVVGCGEKEEPPTTGPVVAQTTTGPTTTPGGNGGAQGGGGNQGGGGQGGGGGGQATPAEQSVATVKLFLTKPNDPSVCDELITTGFLKRSYGDRQGCIAARKPNALADRIAIVGRKPGPGGSIIVTVKPTGGVFAGQTLQVTVVEVGNAWRIDRISGNAKVGP